MTANTPNVGVRTLFNPTSTTDVMIANMSAIGGVFTPGLNINRAYFPPDTPVAFRTDDPVALTAVGTDPKSTLFQAVNQIIGAGVTATVVASVPDILSTDTATVVMSKMVGVPSSWSGAYALLKAQQETGIRPGLLIAPGYTALRTGNTANPIAAAFDGICNKLGIAVAICDAPSANRTVAMQWAADWSSSMNIIATGQGVMIESGGAPVVFDSAASIAALIVQNDMNMGAPYYNPGNHALTGILGPSRSVEFNPSDPSCEVNTMLQAGVNCIVSTAINRIAANGGTTFWGFLNTFNDPDWRMINVIRTRKAILDALPNALLKYTGQNLGVALVTVIVQSIQAFLNELIALPVPALLPGATVTYDPNLNDPQGLRVGGLVLDANWAETPALLDLQIYTGGQPSSFTILSSEIQAALTQSSVSGTLS